jgi:hypothetical protein
MQFDVFHATATPDSSGPWALQVSHLIPFWILHAGSKFPTDNEVSRVFNEKLEFTVPKISIYKIYSDTWLIQRMNYLKKVVWYISIVISVNDMNRIFIAAIVCNQSSYPFLVHKYLKQRIYEEGWNLKCLQ